MSYITFALLDEDLWIKLINLSHGVGFLLKDVESLSIDI